MKNRVTDNHLEVGQVIESTSWYYYMDNLRALALLLGIFFHAAIAYSPIMGDLWPAGDTMRSVSLDLLIWFSHLFRMPLFFLISGFFSYLLISRRGLTGFMKNRFMRIFLPFIIFLPLILLLFILIINWAANNVDNPSPLLLMIKAMQNNPNAAAPPISTTHLWFLYNLFLFCCLAGLVVYFKWFKKRWLKTLGSVKFVLLILPLLLVPSLASVAAPHPAAERIYPELWSFGYYGVFFLLGFVLFQRQELLDEIKPYVPLLLIISVIGYGYFYWQFDGQALTFAQVLQHKISWQHLPLAIIEAYISVFMTFVCLVLGKQFLDKNSKLLRIFSRSSYWIYIIHLPVLFYLQFLLLDVNLGLWAKYLMGSFGTLAIGIMTYYLLVRWSPIGWLLNGKR